MFFGRNIIGMNNRNVKNLMARIVSMALQLVVTWVVTRILVEAIGSDANGYFQMSNDFVNYATILSIALNSMGSRFITMAYYQKDSRELNKYYNSLLYGDIFLAVAMAIPLLIICLNLNQFITISDEYASDVKVLFGVMFFNFCVNIFGTVFSTATFIKNRIDLDSYRIIECHLIKLVVIYILFKFLPARVYYVAVGTLAGTIIMIIRNAHYTKLLVPEAKLFKREYLDFECIKELTASGAWNSVTRISSVLLGGLDLLIANQLVGSTAMGVLSIAKTIPKYFLSSMSTVASVFAPSLLINYAKKDTEKIVKTVYDSINVNSFFCGIVVTILCVLGRRIFILWTPSQDAGILLELAVISIVGMMLLMPLEIIWTIFTATNKLKISSIYLLAESIVTIGIEFLLLSMVDNTVQKLIIIAGTSTVMEIIRSLTFMPIVGAHLLKVPYITFYKPLIRVAINYSVTIAVSILINNMITIEGWAGFGISAIAIAIVSACLSWCIVFNKEEKTRIKSMVLKRIRR